jgi:uncharacterized protein
MLARQAMSSTAERFLVLDCAGEQCVAVYSPPEVGGSSRSDLGVVIIVGGPQYRVGSHRQFVLLARDLARSGIPVIRFDYRGMGDSDGESRTFESIDQDIGIAVTALTRESGVARVVLWGLCDGASAALMYAAGDQRIVGIVAVNPWARTPQVEARTRLRHYYLRRITSAEFWRKALVLRLDIKRGGGDLLGALKTAPLGATSLAGSPYLQRMHEGWRRYGGSVLFVLSGNDYTAREFETWVQAEADLGEMLRRSQSEVRRVPNADHTFSTRAWSDTLCQATIEWLRKLSTVTRA